ncbi:MAG TPA: hypothetical protein VI072_00335 [Polyangiaceae bacterium]
MSMRVILIAAFAGLFVAGSGCDNTHCEEGAVCLDGEEVSGVREDECLMYCARLSTCGAPQAEDFGRCAEQCEKRFKEAPQETAELCACAEWSRCSDLVEGRCSPHPGAGGSSGQATGGTGGTGGYAAGGTGGHAAGGGAGGAGSGGSAGALSDAGAAGSGGTSSEASCTRDCDCPLPDFCRGGVCVPPEAAD